ncbi:hypothetical protein J9303_13710 [Bacillaceae bacterium Marseille-Q3522]|nr:hypothetical protein [Bacillaceae bacterium Marseille-Q3522]
MSHLLNFIVSIFEWSSLIAFPLALFGFKFHKYAKVTLLLACIISLLSSLLHIAALPVAIVVAIQIIFLQFLIKIFMKVNLKTAMVIASIGYGFYTFIQLLIVEIVMSLSGYSYFDILFEFSNAPFALRGLTFLLVILSCYFLQKYDYRLTELLYYLKLEKTNPKFLTIVVINSLLTFILICLAVYAMLTNELHFRYHFVLYCIIVLFIILSIYLFLHSSFQKRRLMEAKKYYLDQEQQASIIVEKIKEENARHFLAIYKLAEKGSTEPIIDYIQKHRLHKSPPVWPAEINLHDEAGNFDELLYAFLVNKRNFARLLNISIEISSEVEAAIPVTLKQIRYLSMVIDEIIFLLQQSTGFDKKQIEFHVRTTEDGISFMIKSDLSVHPSQLANSKLLDVLILLKQDHALVDSHFEPFLLKIHCPVS